MLEENKIHLGDCLDLMPSIPSKSVDMILCDLPYGTTDCEWDNIIDMARLWQEYERVIKDNGAIVLTANSVFTFKLWSSNPSLFRYKWIWEKTMPYRFVHANKMPLSQHEDILIFYKKLPCYNPQMREGFKPYTRGDKKGSHSETVKINRAEQVRQYDETRHPIDIIKFSNGNNHSIHPTQKPVALFEYLRLRELEHSYQGKIKEAKLFMHKMEAI